jgi:hypothetical protein
MNAELVKIVSYFVILGLIFYKVYKTRLKELEAKHL